MAPWPCSTAWRALSHNPRTVWRQADKYGVPRICFVNKMDRTGADLFNCVQMIEDRLGAVPLMIQLPVGREGDYAGVIDLFEMKAIVWKEETLGAEYEIRAIPDDLAVQAAAYREKLVELAVEMDESAMERYLEGNELDAATLRACVRAGTISGQFVPVLNGSAFKNKGVQPLLNAVVDFLPSPTDVAAVSGVKSAANERITRESSDDEPFAALAFKVMTDPFVGSLTFIRIYSGVVSAGSAILNPVKERRERVGRMLAMHANRREDIQEARAGDIIALAGLKGTSTGDTLCDPNHRSCWSGWISRIRSSRWRWNPARRTTRKG